MWKYDTLPESKRADVGETFIKQKKLVNNIIPEIKGTIDTSIFPITDEIIYEIIHSLHRHRREEYLKGNRLIPEIKIQKKESIQIPDVMMWVKNSMVHCKIFTLVLTYDLIQKRLKRKKMIEHLQLVNNPLVKWFKPKELKLVCNNNLYYSPEDSEMDTESGKGIIVVKDLKWRSSTVSISFFNILLFLLCTNYF